MSKGNILIRIGDGVAKGFRNIGEAIGSMRAKQAFKRDTGKDSIFSKTDGSPLVAAQHYLDDYKTAWGDGFSNLSGAALIGGGIVLVGSGVQAASKAVASTLAPLGDALGATGEQLEDIVDVALTVAVVGASVALAVYAVRSIRK